MLDYFSRYGDAYAIEAGIGGTQQIYSASFHVTPNVQDYDLQAIIESSSLSNIDSIVYKIPPDYQIEYLPENKRIETIFGVYNYSLSVKGDDILFQRNFDVS